MTVNERTLRLLFLSTTVINVPGFRILAYELINEITEFPARVESRRESWRSPIFQFRRAILDLVTSSIRGQLSRIDYASVTPSLYIVVKSVQSSLRQ